MFIIFKSSLTIETYSQVYSDGSSTSIAVGVRALYNFKKYFGTRGGLEYIMHGGGINSVKVPIQALVYPFGYTKQFSFHIGAGLAYYMTFQMLGDNTVNEIIASNLGMDISCGIKYKPRKKGLSVDLEIGYSVPKMGEKGVWTISGGVGGSLKYDF